MRFTAVITKEGKFYVAHCIELGVVSQGKTIEEAQANLKEAVELYIDSFGGEDFLTPVRYKGACCDAFYLGSNGPGGCGGFEPHKNHPMTIWKTR